MTKYIIGVLGFILGHTTAFCGGVKYPVSSVNDSLRKEASAVKRLEEIVVEIKSPGSATVTTRQVCTIFNEEGVRYGAFVDYYNKLKEINSISGTLYDAQGKEIKSVKKKDFQDVSSQGDGTLMDDSRFKQHDFYYRNYPYTVEYEESEQYNGILYLPEWHPMEGEKFGVENSKLVVMTPKDYVLRYKSVQYNASPVITQEGNKKIYTWEIKNLAPFKREIYSPQFNKLVPSVLLAPSDFEIEGYKGNMSTWLDFGKFYNLLLSGRNVLPDNIKQQVHSLTEGLSNREKVKVLYDYLQKNTRYISIQLGIGGWQPFDAKFVAEKKYGDCKALSNYMVALLKEAGIKANYVLIKSGSGENDFMDDFPSRQSNHATVCVPMDKDSIWLECTSQTQSEGYLADFTDNRKALLIDEDGGHIVFTKKYTADDNVIARKITGTIDANGNLHATVDALYACQEQDYLDGLINGLSKKEQLEFLKKKINLPTYDIKSFEYKQVKQEKPQVKENLALESSGYATVSGKRLFVTPNVLSRYLGSINKDTIRRFDIQFGYPFQNEDSVVLQIPEGYSIESAPKNTKIATQFGSYESSYTFERNTIIYVRKYNEKEGTFPASTYPVLADFYNNISKADRSRIVFVKKE